MKRFFDGQAADILTAADTIIGQAQQRPSDDPAYAETLARIKQQLDDIRPVLIAAPGMLDLLEEVLLLWEPKFSSKPERLDKTDLAEWLREFVYRVEEKALPLVPDDSHALKHYPGRQPS